MHGVLAQESGPIRAVFGSFENTFLWVTMGVSLIALAVRLLPGPRGARRARRAPRR